jgi:putative transposase
MVTPEAKREAVWHLRTEYQISERQACRVVGISRGVQRYRKRPDRNVELRAALYGLAMKKPKYGFPLLFALLKRNGWKVNHKRVARLYRLLNLTLRRKKRAKRIVRERVALPVPCEPNQHWAMDFVHDSLLSGRKIRCLTLVDICSRYAPAIEVGYSLSAQRVIRTLERLAFTRGLPSLITVDNGPEFICKALKEWSERRNVKLHFIQPGKPTQNAFIESLNGTFRHECLDAESFISLEDGKTKIERWRNEYNTERPHSSLGYRTPEEVEIDFFQRMREQENSGTK